MKKEDLASYIVWFVIIIVGILLSIFVIRDLFTDVYLNMSPLLFGIIAILAGLILNGIVFELGHIVGAKVGGYQVTYLNILYFSWTKVNGKWKFAFKEFDGLLSECRIVPKSKKASLKPYAWYPVLFFVCELILGIFLYINFKDSYELSAISLMSVIVIILGSMIAFYDFVPVKLDTITDGYLLMLTRNEENIKAFNELLSVENALRDGEDIKDVPFYENITGYTAEINMLCINKAFWDNDLEKAKKYIEIMLSKQNEFNEFLLSRVCASKIYLLIKEGNIDEARTFYEEANEKTRRFIANNNSMESLRTYVLIACYLDEAPGEIAYAVSNVKKALSKEAKTVGKNEEALFKASIEDIFKLHPDWKEEIY